MDFILTIAKRAAVCQMKIHRAAFLTETALGLLLFLFPAPPSKKTIPGQMLKEAKISLPNFDEVLFAWSPFPLSESPSLD